MQRFPWGAVDFKRAVLLPRSLPFSNVQAATVVDEENGWFLFRPSVVRGRFRSVLYRTTWSSSLSAIAVSCSVIAPAVVFGLPLHQKCFVFLWGGAFSIYLCVDAVYRVIVLRRCFAIFVVHYTLAYRTL